jgi:hypothetical protein
MARLPFPLNSFPAKSAINSYGLWVFSVKALRQNEQYFFGFLVKSSAYSHLVVLQSYVIQSVLQAKAYVKRNLGNF